LNDYRVISFATHAIVAGEIDGVTEPALVLTPGDDEHNQQNDGLLTASEIANLVLDANLVILSACDTAAPDGSAGGRGLSGLADAFFFAGARAVAVTQWAVSSHAAQQLGAGLVSRSLESNSSGVAEGLRRTMVEYISRAKEDYLAHPRFWAAFVIAGDGALSPLDGNAGDNNDHTAIQWEWDRVMEDSTDAAIYNLAKSHHGESFYTIGLEKPPPDEKRAGYYFGRLTGKSVEVISRSRKMAASGVVTIDDDIWLLGTVPSDNRSSAVFRLLDKAGQERWQQIIDGTLWNSPVSVIKSSSGYVLISIENDYSRSPAPSALILTLVSKHGDKVMQNRYPMPIIFSASNTKNVALDPSGNLIVAIAGDVSASPSAQPAPWKEWTNPLTATKNRCISSEATILFSIDVQTLNVRAQKTIQDTRIVAMRQTDGHLNAALQFRSNCGLARSARLVEIEPGFELKTIFETNGNVNSLDVTDLEVTTDKFVLVGRIWIAWPTTATRETITGSPNAWWEKHQERASAFVLIIGKDGAILGDRVFIDMSSRSLLGVVAQASDRFIAVGNAFGDRGWVLAFKFNKGGSNSWDGLAAWIRWISASFGRAQ
jgi:hypothetical protein